MVFGLLWIPATILASLLQTARNLAQRSLTDVIGVVGATQVRFLFGLPFALLFLALACLGLQRLPPEIGMASLGFTLWGALTQIAATALMLAAMRERSFAVTTAYTKTEPVQVALFGAALLGDALTPLKFLAIAIATAGVIVVSWKPGEKLTRAGLRPAVLGIVSGAFFALSAIGFRGGIQALPEGSFLIRASTILVLGLGLQTLLLVAYMLVADRQALILSLKSWRRSLSAGFLGAAASQFWFIGFSLTTAANVRTLALVEVPLAQIASRKLFAEGTSRREILGMAMIVGGVGLLLSLSLR
ncbi:multidrug DMT transporter permease [Bosea thiooxidans]|uniref:EamA-like transporter family protein n=1 Tax=Bosea thiooxidans TaxID=53254 RepID=A0A0Q3L0M6_9HYPH|nr:EamA family transporter [Bosea thiooxidans]KQK30204.1 multidrug DMT transporter permease [Bosea thiooxidans]SKC14824.1 EamA-like transporter family protein [Bosea thiooxidans]